METILVTGGSGLVGSAIKELNYPFNWIFLNSKVCDLLNYTETDAFFEKTKPDYVIHLAANVGGLYKNMKYPVEMLEENLILNTNVLKISKKHNVKKLIACLSTCIFPEKFPFDETMLHQGPPHESNACYAYSKRILETQCNAYNKEFGCNFVCVIPTNVYGHNDNYNLDCCHVIPALIHKCYLSKTNNVPFIVCGTGNPLRQFIYSTDLAKLILHVLENINETIILSPPEEYTIKYISELIASRFGVKVLFDPTFSDGQYQKTAHTSKLKKLIPDFKFTPIDVGLNSTIDYFIENYSTLRK